MSTEAEVVPAAMITDGFRICASAPSIAEPLVVSGTTTSTSAAAESTAVRVVVPIDSGTVDIACENSMVGGRSSFAT